MMSHSPLSQSICVVLVQTSHPGNVGSVARAMKTMGLFDLRLVQSKFNDIEHQPEAVSLASRAGDVLESARHFSSLESALNDCHMAFALSARQRELGPVLQTPSQAASEAFQMGQADSKVAFVFGAERSGLTNEELFCCNRQVCIEANPDYSSLNLSQAVQIVCYALRLVFMEQPQAPGGQPSQAMGQLASNQAVLQLQTHWSEAMYKVDFINPNKPKKALQRLARLLARAQLEKEEVDMLRGFLSDVERVAEGRLYAHERAISAKLE